MCSGSQSWSKGDNPAIMTSMLPLAVGQPVSMVSIGDWWKLHSSRIFNHWFIEITRSIMTFIIPQQVKELLLIALLVNKYVRVVNSTYWIMTSSGGSVRRLPANPTVGEYSLSGLEPGTTYRICVRGTNQAGNGSYGSPRTLRIPDKKEGMTVMKNNSLSSSGIKGMCILTIYSLIHL